jgi:flagellar export protein FliJ
MPPKFSLQPVLDYRHMRVEVLEVEHGRMVQAQQHATAFLDALQNSRSRVLQQMGESQSGEVDMFMISRLHQNLDMVNERIAQQELHLQELAEQISEKRQELVQAKQDDEALAKLKNQEVERYQVEQARIENRMLDDVYISRAYRRSGSVA